jgi:hypothetical protein
VRQLVLGTSFSVRDSIFTLENGMKTARELFLSCALFYLLLPPSALAAIYVSGNTRITVYADTADGDVAPLRTLEGGAIGLDFPNGIFVDLAHDELFVASGLTHSVRVFLRLANGNVAPIRTLQGPMTGFASSQWIFVSTAHDELYVSDRGGAVRVFSRTVDGNTALIRTIGGDMTGFENPQGIYLNTSDELVVLDEFNAVLVFPRLANGNVAPTRTISGSLTMLNLPFGIAGTNAAGGGTGYVGTLQAIFIDGFEDE